MVGLCAKARRSFHTAIYDCHPYTPGERAMTDVSVKQKGPIHGKVAGILNERELAINIGLNNNVQVGMKFAVMSSEETKVYDPETGDLLGLVDREKVRVQATEVKEKFSICKTYRTLTVGEGPLHEYARIASLFAPPRTVPETLKAGNSDYLPPLSEEESYVKIGDRVVQVSGVD
jgi:hypothetical protein